MVCWLMRILVIEDETKVGCFIKRALEEESYAVDLCEDGGKGLEMALTTNYDAIIVDLMLPSLPGLDIVKGIRRERIQTPILILTAQSQVDQRVKGLDAGADDYLTKPFAIDELLARVRALLRRGATDSPGILQIDDLVLNPATREVTRGGQRIELTLKEYALLEYLMCTPDADSSPRTCPIRSYVVASVMLTFRQAPGVGGSALFVPLM